MQSIWLQTVHLFAIVQQRNISNIQTFKNFKHVFNLFSCSQPVRISQVCSFCFTTNLSEKSEHILNNCGNSIIEFKILSLWSPVVGSQWAEACQDWLAAFWGQPEVEVRGSYLEVKSRTWKLSLDILGREQSGRSKKEEKMGQMKAAHPLDCKEVMLR